MKNVKEHILSDSFISIEGWMVTELGLGGVELILYALIYSFTRKFGGFTGSRSYLSSWSGCSLSALDRHLNSLESRQLIGRRRADKRGTVCSLIWAVEDTYKNVPCLISTTPESGQGVTRNDDTPDSNRGQGAPKTTHNIYRETPYINTIGNARTRAERAGKKKASGERETKQTTSSSFETDDFFLAALRRSFGDDAAY